MTIYFTSDWHLGEDRLGITKPNVFLRPFTSTEEQDETIINNINKYVKPDDTLYNIGDVTVDDSKIELLNKINCKNHILISGNYDEGKEDKLIKYFDEIYPIGLVLEVNGYIFNLVHKPVEQQSHLFNIVGHVHSLWKVKRNMINVSVDAWHFKPVSLEEILFVKNAIDKGYYDENVFYGEAETVNL